MAYELVKFEDDAGQAVQITPQDVRQTFCQNATDKEVQMFLALCATQHLNPWTKDAYLVKYGNNPAAIITSRAAIQKRADSNPEFEGTELGVVVLTSQGAVVRREGEACYKALGEQLLGGWARAYRRGRKPYYSEVPLSEYNTGKNNWARMPSTMICKVAEMHALRGAFPQDFQGMYSSEEMAQAQPAQDVSVEPQHQEEAAPPQEDMDWLRATTAQIVALGYQESEVKGYLWQQYKAGGRAGAQDAAAGLIAAVGPSDEENAAQAAYAGDADAQAADEYELAGEDIEF